MSENPYATPFTSGDMIDSTVFEGDELAGRWIRLSAALVDGFAVTAVTLPVVLTTRFLVHSPLAHTTMTALWFIVWLAINGYLLIDRGQSIGKMLMKIQIVDAHTGLLLPPFRVFVLRYLWRMPLAFIVEITPGDTDDFLGSIVSLGNMLLIFGAERRCLHDYIAGSKVVLYKPNRPKRS